MMNNIKNSLKKLFLIQILVTGIYFNARSQIVFERTYTTVTVDTIIGARCGVQCHDGGYMLGGYAAYGMYASEMMLMKLDSLGNVQWKKFYGEMPTSLNCIYDLIQLDDNSYICCGEGTFITEGSGLKPNNSIIMRVDSHGNLMWYREFDAGWHEMLLDMELTETGVFCVGYAENNTKTSVFPLWIICDFDGENTIIHTLNNVFTNHQLFTTTVKAVNDTTFIIGGDYGLSSVLIKTSSTGDTVSTHIFGLEYPGQLTLKELTIISDKIVFCGYYSENLIEYDLQNYYAIYDLNLEFFNENILEFDNSLQLTKPSQILKISDESFIIGGWLNTPDRGLDIWVKCYNLNDEIIWNRFIGGTGSEEIYEIIKTRDGGYLIIGDSDSFDNWLAIYLVKTDSLCLGNYSSPVLQYEEINNNVLVYPNPATDRCILSIENYQNINYIEIFDIYGKSVEKINISENSTSLDISGLASGIYIVTDNNRSFQRKLIKTNY